MKSTPFLKFLREQQASLRLQNMMHRLIFWGDGRGHTNRFTLSQFIRRYPLDRLKKQCHGFGAKAQKELHQILARHYLAPDTGFSKRLSDYIDSLELPDYSPERLQKMQLGRLLRELLDVCKNVRSTRIKAVLAEIGKRPDPDQPIRNLN